MASHGGDKPLAMRANQRRRSTRAAAAVIGDSPVGVLKALIRDTSPSNASPRAEIQILRYLHPEILPDEHIRQLNKIGMNHICFRVDDIEAEVANIRAAGFQTRNEIMDFHSRKLVFLDGPEGVTVELSQWY